MASYQLCQCSSVKIDDFVRFLQKYSNKAVQILVYPMGIKFKVNLIEGTDSFCLGEIDGLILAEVIHNSNYLRRRLYPDIPLEKVLTIGYRCDEKLNELTFDYQPGYLSFSLHIFAELKLTKLQ